MRTTTSRPRKRGAALGWCVFYGGTLAALALAMTAGSAPANKTAAGAAKPAATDIPNPQWAEMFTNEYQTWRKTADMAPNTKYCGSSVRDYLAADPNLVVLFAGYPFSLEYNQGRGHYHAIEDVSNTKRVSDKTPATCWTCKSPDVPRMMGEKGVAAFYASKFIDVKPQIRHSIGCPDCHDSNTFALHVSRPAIKEAFARQGHDIDKAGDKQMRNLVCAQCHSSYYFKDKQTNYLIFPWDNGTNVDDFDRYYEKDGFSDWTHPISGARMIKLRHPDYEVYSQSVHAFRGVTCADCHMPAKKVNGTQFTDHQARSPLYNIAGTCRNCHAKWTEQEARARVYSIQDKNRELLNIAERSLVLAHVTIGDAAKRGGTDAELQESRTLVRRAQMYWDYVAASNGMGFHAPQECARTLAKANDLAQECRLSAERVRARHGATDPIPMPDLSTKEKAAAFVKPYLAVAASH